MGKSRSATVLLAYLLWSSRQPRPVPDTTTDSDMVSLPPKPFSVVEALTLLRRGRAIAEPNEGFMEQLYLYTDMGCPTTQAELEGHKLYRRWMNKRNVAESLRINQAPDMVDILFEDETESEIQTTSSSNPPSDTLSDLSRSPHQSEILPGISAPTGTEPPTSQPNANSIAPPATSAQQDLLLKCRKCRHLLARSNFILPHVALHSDPASSLSPKTPNYSSKQAQTGPQCAHHYLHPLSWMRPALASGALEGRLTCPNEKCGANIGKFAWQGLRCSCGGWVTPGFAVGRGKVDEVAVSANGGTGGATGGAPGGGVLRLPPGMRRGGKI
jgi:dual specificity phosphatase 12